MTRSTSRGPRLATTWTATQPPRPLPRVVRVGRPANDNIRSRRLPAPLLLALATALALVGLYVW